MPKIFQRAFLLLFLVIAGYFLGVYAGLITPIPAVQAIQNQVNKLMQHNVSGIGDNVRGTTGSASNQLNVLAKRGQEVNNQTQQVLGQYVQSVQEEDTNQSTDKQPLHEQAFEYGRYLYCQQVVKDYEGKHGN